MSDIEINVGPLRFQARFERERSPMTCAAFERLLPFHSQIIQARWSGEAAWIPLGSIDTGIEPEVPTSTPAPGQILFYPGGVSEVEILVPYGQTVFASKFGVLAGNHFLTIVDELDRLEELGALVLWKGAQQISFERL